MMVWQRITGNRETEDRLRLPGMRRAVAEVARTLPRVRRLELARRGALGAGERAGRRRGRHREALQPGRVGGPAALRRHRYGRRRAADDRHRRVRSRARRRRRAGIARADRRRAGHRQVDAAAAGGGALRADLRSGPLLLRRRVRAPDQVARRAARYRARAALHSGGDLPRAHPRGDRAAQARVHHRRLDPDRLLAEVPVGARQHRAGARGRDAAALRRQGPEHPDVSRRARHEGRQPRRAQGRSSTSSTPCCTSKGRSTTRTASSAR